MTGWRKAGRAGCLAVALVAVAAACAPRGADDDVLELPVLLTTDLPFAYPAALYAARVEGDVALHLFVDSLGLVVPDSARIAEPSAHAAFDSSALAGAAFLQFRPAQRGPRRLGHSVILPVQFRVPRDTVPTDTVP